MSSCHDYDSIRRLAKERGCPVTDLLVLAAKNDPFYCHLPRRLTAVRWFARLWGKLDLGAGPQVHVRRLHYRLVSQDPRVRNAYTTVYLNTDKQWHDLVEAVRDARFLDLVPQNRFVDRRNDEPLIRLPQYTNSGAILTTSGGSYALEALSGDLPALPSLLLLKPDAAQRYHLEIWCEKTTVNDILEPLANFYGLNVVTGSGDLSATACVNVVERAIISGLPVRILYLSDFDPAGQNMPVSVARKIEFELRKRNLALDIQLIPIALTHDQTVELRLPRIPIKESDMRGARFEERFGEGATELDALEALHPGRLENMLVAAIERFYDKRLQRRIDAVATRVWATLRDITESVHRRHADEVAALERSWQQIIDQVEDFRGQAERTWDAIHEDLERERPDLSEFKWPSATAGDEFAEPLFDSRRSYDEQLGFYKQHQGKTNGNAGEDEQ
jgi:hypothetical protein